MLTHRQCLALKALADDTERREAVIAALRALAFDKQLSLIDDPCKLKAGICTRRAGKSTAAGIYLFHEMLIRPGTKCLVVCLTRDSAKRIYWKDVLYEIRDRMSEVDGRAHEAFFKAIKFNHTELSMTFPNGSVCYFLGVDAKEDEKRKILGQKYSLAVVDESSEYRIDLRELVYQTLKPCTNDYRGTIVMVGTAGEFLGPLDNPYLFYAVTRDGYDPKNDRIDGGWSTHRWTTFDNPHQREQHAEDLADIEANRPAFKNTTAYLTHYLARWPSTSDRLVYKYTPDVVDIAEAPKCDDHVIAIDLGFNDATSFVVEGYRKHDPNLYILSATKHGVSVTQNPDDGLDFDDVVNEVLRLRGTYPHARIVVDSANKQGVEHMRRVSGLPFEAAEKTGKFDYIRMMNTDLQMGRVRVVASECKPLINEWRSLEWDKRDPTKETDGVENHCADATLYGWRLARHYLAEPAKPPKPPIRSEEAWDAHMDKRSRARVRDNRFL